MSSREVQCEGLGMGLTVTDEGQVCAFIALGNMEDEEVETHVVRLTLERMNHTIGVMMSIANELSSLEQELAAVPMDDRDAHLAKIIGRYSAGMN